MADPVTLHVMGAKIVSASTVIAHDDCPCCGREVSIKLDRNGRAYYRCAWPDLDTGKACGHTVKFSAKKTREISEQYAMAMKGKKDGPTPTKGGAAGGRVGTGTDSGDTGIGCF